MLICPLSAPICSCKYYNWSFSQFFFKILSKYFVKQYKRRRILCQDIIMPHLSPLAVFSLQEKQPVQETALETRPDDRGFGASTLLHSNQSENSGKLCKQLSTRCLRIRLQCLLRRIATVPKRSEPKQPKQVRQALVWLQFLIFLFLACRLCACAKRAYSVVAAVMQSKLSEESSSGCFSFFLIFQEEISNGNYAFVKDAERN